MTIVELLAICFVPGSSLFLLWLGTRRADAVDREFYKCRPDLLDFTDGHHIRIAYDIGAITREEMVEALRNRKTLRNREN